MTMYFDPLRVFLPATLVLALIFGGLLAFDVFVIVNLTQRTLMVGFALAALFILGLMADAVAKKT
jgi:hypothetical protein